MTWTAFLRRSPLLLAVALAALGVLMVHDSPPASADHARITAWSGTLTVGEVLASLNNGCSNPVSGAECSSTSVLTDDDFTYGGIDYAIIGIAYDIPSSGLSFTLNKTIPASMKANATLIANNIALNFADATRGTNTVNNDTVSWSNIGGTAWGVGDTVQLSLSGPGTPDYGVTLSVESMTVNEGEGGAFTVALTANPGADKTVHLVKTQYYLSDVGDSDARWNVNAVSLASTLTFTSSNYANGQPVNVTARQDADCHDEQLVVLIMEQVGTTRYIADGEWRTAPIWGPVGGSDNSVTGVRVTVDDDEPCGGM